MSEATYNELREQLDGQSIAEMEIEARRDAQQAGFKIQQNPFPAGSFESLCYTSECQIHWRNNWRTK